MRDLKEPRTWLSLSPSHGSLRAFTPLHFLTRNLVPLMSRPQWTKVVS